MNEEESQESTQEESMESTSVTPEYQKEVEELIDEATLPELEFVISQATDMKKKLTKSQGKHKLMTDDF